MTRSRILGESPRIFAHVADGLGWLAREAQDAPVLDAMALENGWSEGQALAALGAVPAWRLLQAARVGLGTRLLVLGAGWLRESVEHIAGLRGVTLVDANALPESVILVGGTSALPAALRACRSSGSVATVLDPGPLDLDVYPDLHRRGLRLSLLDPCSAPPDWPLVRLGLSHLVARGSLGP